MTFGMTVDPGVRIAPFFVRHDVPPFNDAGTYPSFWYSGQ